VQACREDLQGGHPYRWPYPWVTEVTTLFKGYIITPFITGRGPTCSWFGKPTSCLSMTLKGKSLHRNKMLIVFPLFKRFFSVL